MRSHQLERRAFITLLGGGAAAWPLADPGQQPAMPVIGFLHSGTTTTYAHLVGAFLRGLEEVGFVDGRSLAIEYRWADGHADRLPALAAELVQRRVNVIVATGGPLPVLAA